MAVLSSWVRPDRWEIRENPEPGVLAALYDTDYPEHGPVHQLLPDPENPDGEWCLARNVVRDTIARQKAAYACQQQEKFRTALNDRFQVTQSSKTITLDDRMLADPTQVKTVVQARAGWNVEYFTLEPDPQKNYRRDHYHREHVLNLIYILQDALNRRPALAWAEEFAARYLQQHPYPETYPAPPPRPPEPAGTAKP